MNLKRIVYEVAIAVGYILLTYILFEALEVGHFNEWWRVPLAGVVLYLFCEFHAQVSKWREKQ